MPFSATSYGLRCPGRSTPLIVWQNNNWIRKRLEDTRNKMGGYQGPAVSTEVYEVFTVRALTCTLQTPTLTDSSAQLAMVIWRDQLFVKIKEKLLRALLELLTKERDGEQVNQSEVRGVIESYGAHDCLLRPFPSSVG